MVKKILARTYIWLILLFMYLPILVLIVYSFTDAVYIGQWNGFSFDLYTRLFNNNELMKALGNTIIIAVTSAAVSTVLGTLGAIGVFYLKKGWRKAFDIVTQIPIVNAEIVLALSLTVLFVFIGQKFLNGQSVFGYWTLLIGHVVLSLPFVYISVKPKLQQMDQSLFEAALDLGCTPSKALMKVTIPEIMPGVLSGFLLSITLSLDDFIITRFTAGIGLLNGNSTIVTLSTYIQDIIRKRPVPAELRALTSILFVIVIIAVIGVSLYKSYQAKHPRVRVLKRREY